MATTYPVKQLHLSPTNPRKMRDTKRDAELADSVRAQGVLVPLRIRPRAKGGFEVVFGARRLDAAIAAGLEAVPADLHEDTDELARELQLVENGQREDVHPLDEADAYKALVDEYRYDAERIAARVGKTVVHVRRRLQLVQLGKAGREEWLAGVLSEDAAFVLSRVPEALQMGAIKTAEQWNHNRNDEDPITGTQMRHVVKRELTLPLASAPFPIDDADLVKKAGACTACPKRTEAQPVLFADLAADNLCTDPACHKTKCNAQWVRLQAKAKAEKSKVLSAAETKKLYPYTHSQLVYNAPWVELDTTDGSTGKTARTQIGKDALPPLVYAQRPDGVPVTLIAKADYERVMKAKAKASAAGAGATKSGSSSTSSRTSGVSEKEKAKQKAARVEQKRKDAARKLTDRRIVASIVTSAEKRELDEAQMRALVSMLMKPLFNGAFIEIAERRGLSLDDAATGKRIDADEAIARLASTSKSKVLCGLLVELLIAQAGGVHDADHLEKEFETNARAIASATEKELERLAETHTKVPGKAAGAKETPTEAAKRSDAVMRATADRMKSKPAKPALAAKPAGKVKAKPAPAKKSAVKSKSKVRP